jgi:hypothetical protein
MMPATTAGLLDGVTVLDLCSYLAGPYGCTLLADLGAMVIKIEAPQGDMLRQFPSSLPGEKGRPYLDGIEYPAMISTPGQRASRRRQRGALPAWSLFSTSRWIQPSTGSCGSPGERPFPLALGYARKRTKLST